MSSVIGNKIKVSVFGQSHSEAIGCVIDGLPAGFKPDMDAVNAFIQRRAPGKNKYSTSRSEADTPEIVSGLADGFTCGAPLCAIIRNTNTRSADYSDLKVKPRPSHADYPYYVKTNGFNDIRGGGHSSGRLTAPLCFAGALMLQLLNMRGVSISAHIYSIQNEKDTPFDAVNISNTNIAAKDFPVIDDESGIRMKNVIESARMNLDSVGGIIECAVCGMPAGIGEPMFDGIENRRATNIFGIPAVKGIEFGKGFAITEMTGSTANDAFSYNESGNIITKTNNNGGILGGMTTGMPIIFRAAIKPTPSIASKQETVNLKTKTNDSLEIHGRHDPCIVPRAVPVIEAVTEITMLDFLM